jgi:hypothetical protein
MVREEILADALGYPCLWSESNARPGVSSTGSLETGWWGERLHPSPTDLGRPGLSDAAARTGSAGGYAEIEADSRRLA